MTIQPGLRIEPRAQGRAATGRAGRSARGKFAPPRFPADLVGIERWQDWLDRLSAHEICLVRAPAGYGKTAFAATLFASARDAGWYAGWVSFDRDDNESAATGHLFEAVRLACGAAHRGDFADMAAVAAMPATILSAALADLIDDGDRPLLLVLDDVDRLTDARVIEVLDGLLRHPPARLRLILSSRATPAIDTGDVERRGMALPVGAAELALTNEEVHAFLQGGGTADDADAAAAANAMLQGWPAGLRLAARHAGRDALPPQIDLHLAPVIGGLSDSERRFLQRCAGVPELGAELGQLLSGDKDSAAMLRDFAARGLFVEPLAGPDEAYRIHPAFRAALGRSPGAPDADTRLQLHRVAARHFAAEQMHGLAAEQAMLAGDVAQAAALLAEIAMPMVMRGELSALDAWMKRLPTAEILAVPALLHAQAWLYALTAHPEARGAIAALDVGGAVREAQAVDSVHRAYASDQLADVVETCDQLLAEPEGLSDMALAMTRALLAHGALKRGLFGLVHDAVRPLRRDPDRPLDLPLALATCTRAALSRAQGQLDDAERLLRDGRPKSSSHSLAAALVDAALARCCYERDDMAAAARLAVSALPTLERSAFQDAMIPAFLVAIRAATHIGQAGKAASLIDRAERLAFEREWTPLKAMCTVERARLRLPQTIDAEAVVATGEEEAAVLDPLSAQARAFALLSEMRAYEAIANGDRPRLTMVAERLLRLAANADDAELRATATLFNILPQLSGRCDKMVELETVRFLNHAASVGFRRTIVDVLDVTGVRAVQNFCSEAYSSGSFLALLKLAEPSRRNPALEGTHDAAPGEAFSFLTEREIEILSALNAGESNKEIARTLQLAPETVKWHLKNVMRKLRANSREEAVQNASTLGLKLIEVSVRH